MNTLENAELTSMIRHIARVLKSGIPIYNSKLPDTTGKKTRRRRRTQAVAKRFAFHANVIKVSNYLSVPRKINSKTCITLLSHRFTLLMNAIENSLPKS